VGFPGLSAGNYYIVIRHRNHLAVMSANAVALSGTSSLYNFTTAQTQAYGITPMIDLGGSIFGMRSGDGNASASVTISDRNGVWKSQNGTPGYLAGDYNLSGGVSTGDRDSYWRTNNGQSSRVP
jgi:hypothetical protein